MMKRFYLIAVLLLVIQIAFGQKARSAQEIQNEKAPKTALIQARKDFRQAVKDKNSPLLIQSLIRQIKYQGLIDLDSIPPMLQDLEKYIETDRNVVEKSILHSLIAEIYGLYYQSQATKLNRRTPITGYIPTDMQDWTTNIYGKKIFQHSLDAVNAQPQLSAVNCLAYKEILILGKNSPALRPTLYDFLVYRSIDLLQQFSYPIKQGNKQVPLDNKELFATTTDFIQIPIETPPFDVNSSIVKLYQSLLKVELEAKRTDAVIISDLDRLQFVSENFRQPDIDSLHIQSLEQLARTYASNPYVVEALYTLAQHYYNSQDLYALRSTKNEAVVRKALDLCNEGIRRFPKYFRIDILKTLARQIQQTEANCKMPDNVYPGENQMVQLNFRNLSDISFTLYKINETIPNYLNSEKKDIRGEKVYTRTFKLPRKLIVQDTTLQIPIATTGLYQLHVSCNDRTDTLSFSSSRIYTIARSTGGKGYNILVCDMLSGKPIKGAKIKLYEKKTSGYKQLAEVTSDENGIGNIKKLNSDRYYQVSFGNDTHAPMTRMPYPAYIPERSETSSIDLFTDRAVYRPGQTVYYSGICWEIDSTNPVAITGKKYNVNLLDVNQQVIAKQDVQTNGFGSFAGKFTLPKEVLNGNFTISVNGNEHFITVAEYKRPKFQITFNPLTNAYKLGDKLTVSGVAKSYSGVNIENSRVTYSIDMRSLARAYTQETIAAGTTRTDDKGRFEISFNTEKMPSNSSGIYYRYLIPQYTVNVTVTSPNGETQEEQYTISISNQNYQLNVLTLPRLDKDKQAKIKVIAQNANGYSLTENITYRLSALKPLQKLGDQYDLNNLPVGQTMLEGTYTTDEKTDLELSISLLPSGPYVLTLAGTGNNKDITNQTILYLYSTKDKRPPYLTYEWIVPEKIECNIGEDARILLGSSAKDVYVLYEIYANQKLMTRERVMLDNSNTTLTIPYQAEYGNQADVVTTFVKDGRLFSQNIRLTRNESSKQLDITTKTFRDHLSPGQQEEWSFVIKNSAGKAVIAEMMATMYDASLDKIAMNDWFFMPRFNEQLFTPHWQNTTHPVWSFFMDRRRDNRITIPEFQYDKLNLYDLDRQYRSRNLFYAMGGKLANMAARSSADELETASDEAIYVTGLSSFKEGQVAMPRSVRRPDMREAPEPSIRQNFQETAFFYPQLLTDSTGSVVIKFTVPESNTTWRFMALAHTPTMQHGQIEKMVVTSKEFMVSTNLPRFVRTGDKVVLQATVNNLTDTPQQGQAYLELFNPLTDVVISKQEVNFNVPSRENQTVSFQFTAPENTDLLGCRIVASSARFSDGEQHVLPVVPDATLVTQTLPIFTSKAGQQTFTLDAPKGITPYRLTLELTANPVWYAVLALPSINTPQTENVTEITASYYVSTLASAIAKANPQITATIQQWMQQPGTALTSPLEKNQELKSVLLQLSPWMTEAQNETQQMHSLAELLDVNRQNYITRQAIDKLETLQNGDGGWSWFKGFYSSPFMTENVLEAMSRLVTLGVVEHPEQVKRMQIKALNFLDKNIQKTYENTKTAGYTEILYLYTRSAYRDIPLAKALEAHKYYMNQLEKTWSNLSLYEKALTAITMHRYGKTEVARQIIASLKEYSTTTPEMGMYWANNRSTLYTNSAIQTHVAIMSAFREIEGNTPDTELMKQWLLRQKQTQNWGSTPTTVDAIYALLLTGNDQLASQERLSVKLGNKNLNLNPEESVLGYIKQTFTGKEITPKMTKVTLTKKEQQVSWGGLYLQYFQKLDQVASHSGGISVQKQLFIEQAGENGNTLVPLGNHPLKVGDRISIRITVNNNQDMQYVHLKDLRAGCFEPTEQTSGNRWQSSVMYYQETTDVATNFFFDYLPKGTHVFEYTVWIAQSGTYQDGISTLQCIYAPQYSANSKAGSITVQ